MRVVLLRIRNRSVYSNFFKTFTHKNNSTHQLVCVQSSAVNVTSMWAEKDSPLTLQELKCYYKYRHQNLPVYLLNWQITPNTYIHNYNTRRKTELHTYRTKHEFAKTFLKYNLPHVINNIPDLVIEKIVTHSLKGFSSYANNYMLQKYNDTCSFLNCYICQLN